MREEEEKAHQNEEEPEEAKEQQQHHHHLIKLRDTGDDNEMVAVKTADEQEKVKEEENT